MNPTTQPALDMTPEPAPPPVREGVLVRLRPHRPDNAGAFIAWYGDADIAEMLRHDLEPLNDIQARVYFSSVVMPASARGTCWAIHDRATDRLVGTTAITDIDPKRRACLFRIVIGDKSVWNRGFGTEATRLVVAEAFEHHGIETFTLEVFAHNAPAQAAYARVGFVESARHVEWVARRRRQLHVIEMQLTRERWLTLESTCATAEPSRRG